ncbi:MAG: cell division protein ZapA [Bdellovibrionales bacterium]|jgi:cell division protein ZapA
MAKQDAKDAKKEPTLPVLAKVSVTLHGLEYIVACDAGEERKLAELVKLVDSKINEVAGKGTNASETRLFMLTCLLLADELIETRKLATTGRKSDEDLMVAAVNHLQGRVASIAALVGKA